MSGQIHLVLGGARSGKSRRAQELAAIHSTDVTYIATCATDRLDPEMVARIDSHRGNRPAHWKTVENRFDLVDVIDRNGGTVFLLDCLTLWLAYWHGLKHSESDILAILGRALDHARQKAVSLLIVSNELGMGLVPEGEENRAFRDLCGRANQLVADFADHVEFVIAGLPLKLK